MTDTPNEFAALRAELERLHASATPGDLTSAEGRGDHFVDCPLCNGDGATDSTRYTNIDGVPLTVEFYGIGDEHMALESLFESLMRNRATILRALRIAEVAGEVEGALADTLSRIETSDAWWMSDPTRGGMDEEKLSTTLALLRKAREANQ